jgi:Ser/Thr protein kinase RdoA (MazF antagonist)
MLLESRVPNPTTETESIHLARDVYSLEVSARSLPGEYDDNFRLITADKRAFVLKVMHPARELSFVDMQARALEHLAKQLPQRLLPRVIPTSDGKPFTTKRAPNGESRIIWLLSYVDGATLAQANPHSAELLESVGQLLGEMDSALAGFDHPAAHRELRWDLARAAWIAGSLDAIENDQRLRLLKNFLALYELEVVPTLPHLRRGVIYGDANDHNVLVAEPWPQPRRAKAVIDFGDMHHTITVSELAIAAAYAILGKDDILPAAAAVISGYHRAYPLQEAEIKILALRISRRVRLSARAEIGCHRRISEKRVGRCRADTRRRSAHRPGACV